MSACEDVKERLCEFLDGELAQADRAVVETHLQTCTACRDELSTLREAVSAVHALERRAAPASVLAGVRAGLQQQPQTPEVPQEVSQKVVRMESSFWWRRALSVAAVLIVAVLIYVAYLPQEPERRAMTSSPAAKEAERTAAPAKMPVAPADAAPAAPAAPAPVAPPRTEEAGSAADGRARAETFSRAKPALDTPSVARADREAKRDSPAVIMKGQASNDRQVETDEFGPAQQPAVMPAASAPVGVGTPPHVAEGESKLLSKDSAVGKFKAELEKLAEARDDKVDQKLAAEAARNAGQGQTVVAQAEPARDPRAVQEPRIPAAKTAAPDVQAKELDAASAESNRKVAMEEVADVAQTGRDYRKASKAPAEPRPASRAGEDRELSMEGNVIGKRAGDRAEALPKSEQLKSAVVVSGRQVLVVPQKDLERVVEDLRRMAASSGGELAWQPADRRMSLQKNAAPRVAQQDRSRSQQAMPQSLGNEAGLVVLSVPAARLDELNRMMTEYQAQQRLNLEMAQAKPAQKKVSGKSEDVGWEAAKQTDKEAAGDYVQIVLDIRSQTAPAAEAAADALRTNEAKPEPAKAKAAESQQGL